LIADAPGEVTLHIEYTQAQQRFRTRTILIGIDVTEYQTIAVNGDMQTLRLRRSAPESVFNPVYLVSSTANVTFGAPPNNKKMEIGLERPFVRLLTLLESIAATFQLRYCNPSIQRAARRAIRFRHAV
jgi:hypothetical protein